MEIFKAAGQSFKGATRKGKLNGNSSMPLIEPTNFYWLQRRADFERKGGDKNNSAFDFSCLIDVGEFGVSIFIWIVGTVVEALSLNLKPSGGEN